MSKKYTLFSLKIIATILATFSGAMGIVGKSVDENENITNYGMWAIIGFTLAMIATIVISFYEYYIKEEEDKNDQKTILENTQQHTKTLNQIHRALQPITSIDFTASFSIDANFFDLREIKSSIDKFISDFSIDPTFYDSNFDKEETKLHLSQNKETGKLEIIWIFIKTKSPLFPSEKHSFAMGHLKPNIEILFSETNKTEFLRTVPKTGIHSLADMYLPSISDLVIAGNKYYDDKSGFFYWPKENRFRFSMNVKKATITFDNGTISSIVDLNNKYVTLFLGLWPKNLDLDEMSIQFNKSENNNLSSLIRITKEDCVMTKEEGRWKTYTSKLGVYPFNIVRLSDMENKN